MDRLISLRVFVAAVEEGSLTGAARRLDMSPAMASKYVASEEKRLQARLLHRNSRSLGVTAVGHVYYRRCSEILNAFDEAIEEASSAQRTVSGVLRIAAPVTFGALHLGDVVSDFLNDHPAVEIEVLFDDEYVDIIDGGIDLAVRIGRLRDSDLVARRLAPCRMIFCASPGFLDKHGSPNTPEQLRRLPRVQFEGAVSDGGWSATDSSGRIVLVDGPVRLRANNMQALLSAATAGIGIAYGPSFAFNNSVASGELVPLLTGYRTFDLDVNVVFPTARLVSTKVKTFVDYLNRLKYEL